jgi:hypothetical protein
MTAHEANRSTWKKGKMGEIRETEYSPRKKQSGVQQKGAQKTILNKKRLGKR